MSDEKTMEKMRQRADGLSLDELVAVRDAS